MSAKATARILSAVSIALASACVAAPISAHAADQDTADAVQMIVHAYDLDAASTARNLRSHIMVQQATPAGANVPVRQPAQRLQRTTSVSGWYPADLTYGKGAIVSSTTFNNIYVNCAATCWGVPAVFQANLVKSSFIHVSDQYTGLTTNGRYTVGTSGNFTYNFYGNTLYYSDILAIVHASAAKFGSGYGHFFNIFLPPGVNTCDQNGACYKGTTPAQFCAYHASVDFTDVGHVIYGVEPYQNVPGCAVPAGSPNGELIDSTSSTLLHETFETITDPDDGTGWYASDAAVNGEVGDLCGGRFFISTFGTKTYATQFMYSNTYHACANGP
jgi:hypothetical protein